MQPRAFLEPVRRPQATAPEGGHFDSDCFDFTCHLARRLDVDCDLASELLAQWLRVYEPACFASEPVPKFTRAPPSGPRSSSVIGEQALRTGTAG
jgi:hypothetical protein